MLRSCRLAQFPLLAAVAAAIVTLLEPAPARADDPAGCRIVEFDMTPAPGLQIVVWIEDSGGNYVDTIFITRLTGSLGLGNRPGMLDFNSAWRWPYGRRESTFPVWAHRHGRQWPLLEFQNDDDRNLSHPLGHSSYEAFYCRPLREDESMWDAQTCSSIVFTDKGKFSDDNTSLYPPRSDIGQAESDHDDVAMFATLNPFDAVSRSTPRGDEAFRISWPIPQDLPDGNYVGFIEVNSEFDGNDYYAYPEPVGIPWSEYGIAYRGQPSVVYRLDFAVGSETSTVSTTEYIGYGDPDGLDGNIRQPDVTITTGVDGSGASRLLLAMIEGEMTRAVANARPAFDLGMPGAARDFTADEVTPLTASASFLAPGDDGDSGPVTGYEIRFQAGEPLDESNFDQARPFPQMVVPVDPGRLQTLELSELLPSTNYYIGVRAFDECRNLGPLEILSFTTPAPEAGTVDACFIATAAYGSLMDADVTMLRKFRDRFLRTHATGELLVEGYYTFGPALAGVISRSETLRRAARAALGPVVDQVRTVTKTVPLLSR